MKRFIKNKLTITDVIIVVLLALYYGNNARASEYLPANFAGNGFAGFEIKRSDITDDISNVLIPCQAIIETNGTPSNYNCTTALINKHHAFLRAVAYAIPRQKFIPARVNGKTVRTIMDFTVVFVCKNGSCANTVTRNHLHHYKKFGMGYVSPQPIIAEDEWYAEFKNKVSWSEDLIKEIDDLSDSSDRTVDSINVYSHYYPGYVVSAEIATDGTVSNTEITGNEKGKQAVRGSRLTRTTDNSVVQIMEVDFIPGFYKGKPVAMRFIESTMAKVDASVNNNASQGVTFSPDATGQNEAAWRSMTEGRY